MAHVPWLKLPDGSDERHGQSKHHRQADGPIKQRSGETLSRARKRGDREGKPSLD
jgi:hypothetical protein